MVLQFKNIAAISHVLLSCRSRTRRPQTGWLL